MSTDAIIDLIMKILRALGLVKPDTPTPDLPPDPAPPPRRVTARDDFRALPTITAARMAEILKTYPMEGEAAAIHAATGGRPLPLAQSWMESRYGQDANAQATKNPLGLMDYTGQHPVLMVNGTLPLRKFNRWAEAFTEWCRRMDTPGYSNGVYPQGATLAQFIRIYVAGPGPGYANGESAASVERYLNETVARLNRYYGTADTPETPPSSGGVTFGRVPPPANYSERIIAPGINTAWDDLGPRKPRGLVLHRMLGTLAGTDAYFRNEARTRACTDFGIGQGLVYRWTRPGANIAPWASGPANGISGDAAPFWRAYQADPAGVGIFNRDCESIEIEGRQYSDPVSNADYQRLVELVAWRADAWLRIPWHQWPLNNDGVHCLLGHSEITRDKPCPGEVVYGLVGRLIEDVRGRLRSFQA